MLPSKWIMIYSCSTADLISNKELLTNIMEVEIPMRVHCKMQMASITKQGSLGNYPERVWYNPHGIANITSMNNVSKHYQMTMDTRRSNTITLHRKDRSTVVFTPSEQGLYKYALKDKESFHEFWSLITTASDHSDRYTRWEFQQAKAAY